MPQRNLSLFDTMLVQLDQTLRTLAAKSPHADRPSPGENKTDTELEQDQARHIAGLMRVNHTGEVCAQALYQGQALTAKLPEVRENMRQAAQEEEDHLAWCQERLDQLHSHTSVLNPLFYAASFGIGAAAGMVGDKWSLGFVAETEKQVCRHLEKHLEQVPESDQKTRAILEQMHTDEAEHAVNADAAGAAELPFPVKIAMGLVSRVMTGTTYRI